MKQLRASEGTIQWLSTFMLVESLDLGCKRFNRWHRESIPSTVGKENLLCYHLWVYPPSFWAVRNVPEIPSEFVSLYLPAVGRAGSSHFLPSSSSPHHTLTGTIVLVINLIDMIVNSILTMKVGFWTCNITNHTHTHTQCSLLVSKPHSQCSQWLYLLYTHVHH